MKTKGNQKGNQRKTIGNERKPMENNRKTIGKH
jgi:hypothetical protein